MPKAIDRFSGENRFLSNFYKVKIVYHDQLFPTLENAYQAAKVPTNLRFQFQCCTPGQSKRLSREIGIREDWDEIKVSVMQELLEQKFACGSYLARKLKRTGDVELIEGNTWGDTFWGVCDGKGKNMLGKLLMDIRQRLLEGDKGN
ncbi:MAG: NADAR family protein [Candidatus Bathyarchaeota archaeon]